MRTSPMDLLGGGDSSLAARAGTQSIAHLASAIALASASSGRSESSPLPSGGLDGVSDADMPAVMEYLERMHQEERARRERADRSVVKELTRIRIADVSKDVPHQVALAFQLPPPATQ